MKFLFRSMGCFSLFAVNAALTVTANAGMISPWVSPVYGTDDRKDLYEVTDASLRKLADSTVALIEEDNLRLDTRTSSYSVMGSTLRERKSVCSTERFVDQLTLAFCSGALVGPDLVLTAGHCITDADECSKSRMAFGYSLPGGEMDFGGFAASEVYSCKEIVGRAQDDGGADFAVIRLDRAVAGHTPLKISRGGPIEKGTPLVVIGHPSGLPVKVADNAAVRDTSDPFKFVSNLDTYAGNSGSPVFNARTGLIEGILVSGETDYVYDAEAKCTLNKLCADDGCRGEKSTRVSYAAPFIPAN